MDEFSGELICSRKKERKGENKELERKERLKVRPSWPKVGVSKGRETGTVNERKGKF